MANLTTRFLLIVVLVFFVASMCEGRGSRGGGRFRSSYRYRSYRGGSYRGGSYSSGGGSSTAGMVVGIIFGVIGGIISLVVFVVLCRVFFCNSDGGSAKYSNSGGVVLSNPHTTPAPYTTATATGTNNGYVSTDTTTTSPSDKAFTNTGYGYAASPPSYEAAVNQKEGDLPYSSQSPADLSYPSYPSNPPPDSGFSTPSAYETSYSSGAAVMSQSSSYDRAEGGNAVSGASASTSVLV